MTKKLSDPDVIALLGKDGLFRFAYVPFVVAEVAWDRVDTICKTAADLRLDNKPLCRAVRRLRCEYEILHSRTICSATRRCEAKTAERMLDDLDQYCTMLNHVVRNEIAAQWPELGDGSKMFLSAVYAARVTVAALLGYYEAQRSKVAALVGHPIGKLLHPPFEAMASLLPVFCGDSELLPAPGDPDPRRRRFVAVYDSFVRALTNKINAIQLNDTEPPTH